MHLIQCFSINHREHIYIKKISDQNSINCQSIVIVMNYLNLKENHSDAAHRK